MTVGTLFDGVNDYIESNTGTDLASLTAYTIGGLTYLNGAARGTWLLFDNGATPVLRVISEAGAQAIERSADFPFIGSGYSSGSWYLWFVTKAAGTVAPRFHVTSNGSSWTHADADAGTMANPGGVITVVRIGGDPTSGEWVAQEVATLGLWGEDSTDGTIETYTNYATLAAKSNKEFFTGESLISGGTMVDSSAHTNSETSRVGATTGTQAVPSWFTNFGANLGTLGRPTRLIEAVKSVGTVTNTTGGTTSAITVAAGGVPVGNSVVIIASHDNSNTVTAGAIQVVTVADTRGNTWNTTTHAIADPGAANAGQEGWIAWCNITTALQAGDTITITYAISVAAKAIRAHEFKYMGGLIQEAVQNNQTGQAVSVDVTPTGVGQLVIGGVMVEGGTADGFTQDADTTNGAWVNPGRLGSGTTTAGATLNPIYKIVTAPGAQNYGGATMLTTSRDHCAALAVFACLPYATRLDAITARHHGGRMERRR